MRMVFLKTGMRTNRAGLNFFMAQNVLGIVPILYDRLRALVAGFTGFGL